MFTGVEKGTFSGLIVTAFQAIGGDEILHPKEESAERMAKRLNLKGVLDSLDVSDHYNFIEVVTPDRYVGGLPHS